MTKIDVQHEELSYTFSLITQNDYKFYSLTIPSDILAETCYVTNRFEDPQEGFQRRLDEKRAREIANYIDSGFGTIPSAIILSAQPEAELTVKAGGRALKFKKHPKSFLVIDGQHRVFGYRLANSHMRVPVVIYQGLSRTQETRLFIDINTKQRPVPNELLLDIKHLADLEGTSDTLLRSLFDIFKSAPDSILLGKLSSHEKIKGKVSRTTFKGAFSSIEDILVGKDSEELYFVFNSYLHAFSRMLNKIQAEEYMITPNVFKAIISFFPDAASKVKDRFEGEYSADNFVEVLTPVFSKVTKAHIIKTGRSYKNLQEAFSASLSKSFSL
jgi:DGQHR domain-containing protein